MSEHEKEEYLTTLDGHDTRVRITSTYRDAADQEHRRVVDLGPFDSMILSGVTTTPEEEGRIPVHSFLVGDPEEVDFLIMTILCEQLNADPAQLGRAFARILGDPQYRMLLQAEISNAHIIVARQQALSMWESEHGGRGPGERGDDHAG